MGIHYALIFVHGTFSSGKTWRNHGCRPGLKTRLADALGEGRIVAIRIFEWRGFAGTILNNGHRYRLSAAIALADEVKRLKRDQPNASVFLVCHSHGGNVAAYACNMLGSQDLPTGIVFLGTPFIHGERGPIAERAKLLTGCGFSLASLLCLGLAIAALAFMSEDQRLYVSVPFSIAWFLFARSATDSQLDSTRAERYLLRIARESRHITIGHIRGVRGLNITTGLDEAAWWLRIWNCFTDIALGLLLFADKLISVLFYLSFAGVFVLWLTGIKPYLAFIALMILQCLFLLCRTILLIAGFVVKVLLRGSQIGTGERIRPAMALNYRISTTIEAPNVENEKLKPGGLIAHSALTSSEEACSKILTWMERS
jgi:pimeloyl-ACP methyl ester carboxylesterase